MQHGDDDDYYDPNEDDDDEDSEELEAPVEDDDGPSEAELLAEEEAAAEAAAAVKTSTRKTPQRLCLECGAPNLVAVITLRRTAPITATGASVKVGGIKVGQMDLRDTYVARPDGTPRTVRGPIFCEACGAEHYLTVGKKTILHLGTMTGVDPEAV